MALLSADSLLTAYKSGAFAMAESRYDKGFSLIKPERRAILPLKKFHLPRRLRATVNSKKFTVKFNTSFHSVIHNCASRHETWINEDIITLFNQLHQSGDAHSIEAWHQGQLAGGIYGLAVGGAFYGESMFSAKTDASKVALVHLIEHLNARGFILFDVQFVTPHLEQFGVQEIGHFHFMSFLQKALTLKCQFYP